MVAQELKDEVERCNKEKAECSEFAACSLPCLTDLFHVFEVKVGRTHARNPYCV